MEEILHQLIGSLSRHLQVLLHPRWCRISAINSIIPFNSYHSTSISCTEKINVFHLNNNRHLPWDTHARPPCRIRSRRISAVRKSEPREIHLKFHGDGHPENWDQILLNLFNLIGCICMVFKKTFTHFTIKID